MTDVTESASPGKRRAWRILVLDDDELSAAVQSQLLQLLGHDSSAETSGSRAIERAATESLDLMLVDLAMPGLDGFEVLRRLRQSEAQTGRRALPLIAVTGFVSPEDRARCLNAGFADHLSKPVQLSKMQAAIESALGTCSPPGGSPAVGNSANDAERLRASAQRLGQMAQVEQRFSPTVTEAFALRSAQLIDSLHRAIDDGDREQAVGNAKALDANARFLGASRLSSSAAVVAQHCEAGDWPQARRCLLEFEHQQQAVLTVLLQIER
jgi:CheY-like chemotaxis protein